MILPNGLCRERNRSAAIECRMVLERHTPRPLTQPLGAHITRMKLELKSVTLALLTLTLTGFVAKAGSNGVTGIVKSRSGKPLAGVRVFCRGDRETETDSTGQFALGNRGKVIFLQIKGYDPVVLVTNSISDRIEIVMEDAAEKEWLIPSCERSSSDKKFAFGPFRLVMTERAEPRRGSDVDYTDFSVSHGSGSNRRFLSGIFGPMATSGFPFDDWITSSVEFKSRSWRNGEATGIDIRGRAESGKLWRYVGMYGFSISYSEASQEASESFDRILDSACFQSLP